MPQYRNAMYITGSDALGRMFFAAAASSAIVSVFTIKIKK